MVINGYKEPFLQATLCAMQDIHNDGFYRSVPIAKGIKFLDKIYLRVP